MNKYCLYVAVIAIVAALGAVGILSAISSMSEAQALSCRQQLVGCHGCAISSQGAIESDKCVHLER